MLPRRLGALLREAWCSAWASPVASLLTAAMVAGMCIAVLTTAGRTQAQEAAALAQIDTQGTRSIVLRAGDGAGLRSTVVERVRALQEVEAVSALGPVVDVRNARVPGGTLVGMREGHGDVVAGLGAGQVRGSELALARLGLEDAVGAVRDGQQGEHDVVGLLEVPEHLQGFEPLLVAGASEDAQDVAIVVILVDAPHHVAAVVRVLPSLLDVEDPARITIETSERLADVRAAVQGELGRFGRGTVLGAVAITGVLLTVNLVSMVVIRRREFGRRRALGASQALIVGLLLLQTGMLAALAAILSTLLTLGWFALRELPSPTPLFAAAVAGVAIVTALVAALVPALLAARREPLHELRVP